MLDMTSTIAAKSDQLNSDDLMAGPRTITVTRVTGNEDNAEQPVNVFFEGDGGKPFRPCKSMRRVMVKIWGPDASKYAGRSMTIYRDPKVKWGGMEVGGIRISHMTGIDKPETLALTETRSKRQPYTVQPLKVEERADEAKVWAEKFIANVGRAPDSEKLNAYIANVKANLVTLEQDRPELHAACDAAITARRKSFAAEDLGSAIGAALDRDDEPADEVSPTDAKLANIRTSIADVRNLKGLAAIDGEWVKARAAYDDQTADEIDKLISARRKELD